MHGASVYVLSRKCHPAVIGKAGTTLGVASTSVGTVLLPMAKNAAHVHMLGAARTCLLAFQVN